MWFVQLRNLKTYHCSRLKSLLGPFRRMWKKKKRAEPLEQLLQMKEETQNTHGRGRDRRGRGTDPSNKSLGHKEEKEQSIKIGAKNWCTIRLNG